MDNLKTKVVIKEVNQIVFSQIFRYIKILGYTSMQNERNMIIDQIRNLKKQSNNLSFISKTLMYNHNTELEDYIINVLNLIYEYIGYICDEIVVFNTIMDLNKSGISFLPKESSNDAKLNLVYNDSIHSMMMELKKQKYKFKKKKR